MARRAHSLATLLRQVNERFPLRDTASDGWVGDEAHRSRTSDHNPNSKGVVRAQDLTHDPASGADMNELAGAVIQDERTSFVIWNRRIWSRARRAEGWRPYSGSNPHTKHLHVSVSSDPALYDDPAPWKLEDEVPLTDEDIQRIWAYPIKGKHAWSRLHDADVRTAEIKEKVTAFARQTAASAADIARAVVNHLSERLSA